MSGPPLATSGRMTPSYPQLRRGPARPLNAVGTVVLALLLVLAIYFIGRHFGLNIGMLFDGGR